MLPTIVLDRCVMLDRNMDKKRSDNLLRECCSDLVMILFRRVESNSTKSVFAIGLASSGPIQGCDCIPANRYVSLGH